MEKVFYNCIVDVRFWATFIALLSCSFFYLVAIKLVKSKSYGIKRPGSVVASELPSFYRVLFAVPRLR